MVAFVTCLLVIMVLMPFAETVKLIDTPGGRKTHSEPVSVVGGIAIYLGILAAALLLKPSVSMAWLLASSSVLVVVGVLDDAYNMSVKCRLFSQFLAGSIMLFGSGCWVQSVIPELRAIDEFLSTELIAIPLTLFFVVGVVNAFNMSDGIDGLAAGNALIALGAICTTVLVVHGELFRFEWMLVFMAAIFAFWIVNLSLTPLRRVFLGDAGSLLLGFIVAWCLIFFSQKPVNLLHPLAALWCVAIPVFDSFVVIVRRLKQGVSPFLSDRNHLHHLLIDIGLSNRATLSLILALSTVLSVFGIWLTYMSSSVISLVAYKCCLLGFTVIRLRPGFERRVAVRMRLVRRRAA